MLAEAQKIDKPLPALRYKNEFAFDMSGFLFYRFPEAFADRNSLGLMYKRRIGRSFFRLGIDGSYLNNYSFDGAWTRVNGHTATLGTRIGYERMMPFWRRFAFNFGVDAYGSIAENRQIRYDDYDLILIGNLTEFSQYALPKLGFKTQKFKSLNQ